ncbi:hypothetical protein C2S53_012217 [Perilla frutescens var. hirtella]|uniref:Serine aminopeptidase S33 domain-containing protein n=1 Tax=Perilla frutescens var. hirtella TaxID=608512 RepID=A0AAD4IU36_PERFH|nr:hypothetical protein C2S53_012217 [Perilla frutescens var. hirtella]
MAAAAVSGLCAASFRRILHREVAVGKLKSYWATCSSPSVALHVNGSRLKINSSLSTKDYLEPSKVLMEFDDGGPPRWSSPLECGCRSPGSPLLLFLPDLVKLVQSTVRTEQNQVAKRPIYLVGESLGASLALVVAAQNPDIDLVLILANPATNFSKSLVQSFVPLSYMIHKQLNAGLLHGMSSIPEKVLWKLEIIQEMQNYLNSHLHDVKAQTLILTSGKDMLLTSITEGQRLNNLLKQSQTHSFIGNGDPLFSDDEFDLVAAIKSTSYYRRGASKDYISDFLPPSPSEFKSLCESLSWMNVAMDPVMLSTVGGKVVRGLAGIPSEGPVLLVSNHMMLGMELVPLLSRFWIEQNIKLRALAHPAFFERLQDGKYQDLPHFDVVRMSGAVPVSASNLYRLLKLKSHVLLYPGGLREAFHRRVNPHKLIWPDEPEFVRMAAKFGAKIVPFCAVGEDDIFQLLLDSDDQMKIPLLKAQIEELTNGAARLRSDAEGEIGKQFLYHPMVLPKLPGRFYFLFGESISTEGRRDVLTDKDKAREVYSEVKTEIEKCIEYLKGRREKDPYRNLLVRLLYQTYHGFDSQVPTFEI